MSFSHDDRWGSDLASAGEFTQSFPSLGATYSPSCGEELLEVTIEFPSGVLLNIDSVSTTDPEITSCSASGSGSSERLVVANAKQFSKDLKRKLQAGQGISQRDGGGYSCRSAPEPVVPHGGETPDALMLCRSVTKRLNRNGSCTQRAIHGLRFISSKENEIAAWSEVRDKFANLSKDGYLCRSDFGRCIGLRLENENSKEFAEELFDALCRRRSIMVDKITLQELYEFWYQIADESFDSRLQIFFNMVNKNGDGRITENEVKEIIILSASANNLSRLRERAEEYAALIMEELSPDGLPSQYIETVSVAIIIGMLIHASSHLACDFPRIVTATDVDYKRYLVHYFGVPRPTYFDLVKGPVGITGFIMVIFMLIAYTLASRRLRRNLTKLPKPFDKLTGFNAFWYSHHLLLAVYVLLIIHGVSLFLEQTWYHKTIWMYLACPVLLYGGERMLRFFRSRLYSVEICKVVIYPGNVIVLHMSKPTSFEYKSGQYIFLQCPAVSKFEWHPFSITSSPGDDYLSIHIRQLGDWTEGIKKAFSVICQAPDAGKSGLLRADGPNKTSLPELLIDGPYGSPAQDHWKYDVLLLVGLGIGATPFISILRDLLNKIVKQHEKAEGLSGSCSNSNVSSDQSFSCLNSEPGNSISTNRTGMLNTKNAYFYWVTREQGSFDWFRQIMSEIADSDIKVRTHFGRPKWKKVLSKISTKHKNARIGVFYCGGPSLGKELSTLCHEFNQTGCSRFEFRKEQF
uniref:FAD-binding FR-type domain-containing protein n=1 Tax=Brassica campestris TaxID=3711 RepID=M4EWG7_BRACM